MEIGKLLALGAAGYIAYEYFIAPKMVPVSTATGGYTPGPTPPTTSINPNPLPPVYSGGPAPYVPPSTPGSITNPLTTRDLVLAAATADGFSAGNVDEWDYYYAQARGIPAPDPLDWGFDDVTRQQVLTFPEWWSTATANGLSGRSGYVRGRV